MSAEASSPAEDWKSYLCNINGQLASILVNLGLSSRDKQGKTPYLLWVWLEMNAPRPDGLSSSDEAPKLYDVEDALAPALAQTSRAILAGRITTQNQREFYFYGETTDSFESSVASALSAFPEYRFRTGSQPDPEWNQYRNVLFPSPQQQQRIANADVLEVLARKGDVHTLPRPVDHWITFDSEAQRAAFATAVQQDGFEVAEQPAPEPGEPFGISIIRTQPVDQPTIDATVLHLFALAEQFSGTYDGWGCVATPA